MNSGRAGRRFRHARLVHAEQAAPDAAESYDDRPRGLHAGSPPFRDSCWTTARKRCCRRAPRACPIYTPQHDALLRPNIRASIQHHLSPSIRLERRSKEFGMRQQVEPITKRTIRRHQLREMVPLADTTIYDMEQRGEFPQRFYLTSRCVVWDLAEVEAWLEERRRASRAKAVKRAPIPDVQLRKTRPIKHSVRA